MVILQNHKACSHTILYDRSFTAVLDIVGNKHSMRSLRRSLFVLDVNLQNSTRKAAASKGLRNFLIIFSTVVEKYNDAIHQLDKLNSFPAIAFELFSSMARALGL